MSEFYCVLSTTVSYVCFFQDNELPPHWLYLKCPTTSCSIKILQHRHPIHLYSCYVNHLHILFWFTAQPGLLKCPTTSCSTKIPSLQQRSVTPSTCTPITLIVYTFYSNSQLMKPVTSSNATFLPIWILPTTLSAASGTLNKVCHDLLQQLNGRIHLSVSTLKTILSSCSQCASILTSSYSILRVQISFITSSIILYQFITLIYLLERAIALHGVACTSP